MIYTPLTKQALRLCFEKHKEQMDKSGVPYVFHPFHVAESMTDEYTTCVALLHDIIEDTDVTAEDLLIQGFPQEVVEAIKLLTHNDGSPYLEYVTRIKPNPLARTVKLADLRHNMDLTRLDEVTDYYLQKYAIYQKAMEVLTND